MKQIGKQGQNDTTKDGRYKVCHPQVFHLALSCWGKLIPGCTFQAGVCPIQFWPVATLALYEHVSPRGNLPMPFRGPKSNFAFFFASRYNQKQFHLTVSSEPSSHQLRLHDKFQPVDPAPVHLSCKDCSSKPPHSWKCKIHVVDPWHGTGNGPDNVRSCRRIHLRSKTGCRARMQSASHWVQDLTINSPCEGYEKSGQLSPGPPSDATSVSTRVKLDTATCQYDPVCTAKLELV